MKEVANHRKKLNGRRLDYDYKRSKMNSGSKGVTEHEVQISNEKLEKSIPKDDGTSTEQNSSALNSPMLSQSVGGGPMLTPEHNPFFDIGDNVMITR